MAQSAVDDSAERQILLDALRDRLEAAITVRQERRHRLADWHYHKHLEREWATHQALGDPRLKAQQTPPICEPATPEKTTSRGRNCRIQAYHDLTSDWRERVYLAPRLSLRERSRSRSQSEQGVNQAVQATKWEFKPRWHNPDVERYQYQPSRTRATTTEDLKNSVIPPRQLSGIHQAPSDTVGRRCSVDFQNHSRDDRQHCHPCHYEDAVVCSKAMDPSSTRRDKGSEEALPREVNLEETSRRGEAPTRGPRARALCVSGQTTGSGGTSTRAMSHNTPTPEEEPGTGDRVLLQEDNLGGVPSQDTHLEGSPINTGLWQPRA